MDSNEPSDEALLAEAIGEGSLGLAFEKLVARHRPRVWSVCYRLMDNEADAQDAVQEVFVRLFLHRTRFAGRSQFSTWLHGIAVRTCLGLRRGRARRRRHESTAPDETWVAQAARPELAAGTGMDLRQMLDTLEENDRALLLLKYTEGYTYDELAELFQLSTSACKMRVSRACQRLHDRFGPPPDVPSTGSAEPQETP